MIPYGKHYIDEDDIQAVVDVLRGGFLTQGPKITEFENAFSHYVGSKYAVAVSSCTAGLHLATVAAGLGPGDTLITSPITFVASANAGLYAGGDVAFADIDPTTINIDPSSLEASLEDNPKTKVVIPVHFAGLPCEMKAIKTICDRAGAVVVEDAAHALGATYQNGKRVGSCCYSLMTVFSLHPVKLIAAGEGGVITTNDEKVYHRLLRLRSHGINKSGDSFINNSEAFTADVQNPWYYEMQELGYHYRLTDIQAALANSQLKKIDQFLDKRRQVSRYYHDNLQKLNNSSPAQSRATVNNSAHHLFVIRINFKAIGMSRALLMSTLRQRGIISQVHYIPVPMHPYYSKQQYDPNRLTNAIEYYNECLSLPIYFALSQPDQDFVLDCLSAYL
jgi:perosamine synthetase